MSRLERVSFTSLLLLLLLLDDDDEDDEKQIKKTKNLEIPMFVVEEYR